MKLVVAGATGGIGRLLCARAVEAGHDVTALARNPESVVPGVRMCRADLSKSTVETVAEPLTGADAVLSALGPRNGTDIGVVTTGTRLLLAAMRVTGVSRIAIISAAPIGGVPTRARPRPPRDPGDGPLMRFLLAPIVRRVFRASYADLAEAEESLRTSTADWTALRPPRLTGGPATGRYRTALDSNVRGGLRVSRADVADVLLRAASAPDWAGHTVGVAD